MLCGSTQKSSFEFDSEMAQWKSQGVVVAAEDGHKQLAYVCERAFGFQQSLFNPDQSLTLPFHNDLKGSDKVTYFQKQCPYYSGQNTDIIVRRFLWSYFQLQKSLWKQSGL